LTVILRLIRMAAAPGAGPGNGVCSESGPLLLSSADEERVS
jgi:hypothetical protein